MATYEEMNNIYHGQARGRMEMAARQQAFIYSADGRPDIAALGVGIVGGNLADIDAIIAAVSTGPSADSIEDDTALLGAVQFVWPSVAAARYPQGV